MTVLLVAGLVVAVIVLIRYSGDSPTGSSAASGCYYPHQVNQTNIVWIKYKLMFAIRQYQYCVR